MEVPGLYNERKWLRKSSTGHYLLEQLDRKAKHFKFPRNLKEYDISKIFRPIVLLNILV